MSNHPIEVDPRRQREFIDGLNRHLGNVSRQIAALDSGLGALGRDWEDAQFVEFRERARRMGRILSDFIEEGRKISRELVASAEDAEAYERTRERD